MNDFLDATAWVLPVVLAVTLHEAAHGWMAERYGDDTARVLGRVTLIRSNISTASARLSCRGCSCCCIRRFFLAMPSRCR